MKSLSFNSINVFIAVFITSTFSILKFMF